MSADIIRIRQRICRLCDETVEKPDAEVPFAGGLVWRWVCMDCLEQAADTYIFLDSKRKAVVER